MSEIEFIPNEITIQEMVDTSPPPPIEQDKAKRPEVSIANAKRKGMKYKPRKPKESPSASFEQLLTASEPIQPKVEEVKEVKQERKDDEQDLKQTISDIKPSVEQVKVTQQQKVYITGRMFLFMINMVIPFSFATIYNMFSKKEKVKSEDIKLTQEEMNDLEELADEVTKEIIGTISPMSQFIMYMGICYGAKMMFAPRYQVNE